MQPSRAGEGALGGVFGAAARDGAADGLASACGGAAVGAAVAAAVDGAPVALGGVFGAAIGGAAVALAGALRLAVLSCTATMAPAFDELVEATCKAGALLIAGAGLKVLIDAPIFLKKKIETLIDLNWKNKDYSKKASNTKVDIWETKKKRCKVCWRI